MKHEGNNVLTKSKRNLFTTQWAWFGSKGLTTKPT